MTLRIKFSLFLFLFSLILAGCGASDDNVVVVYTAHDRQFSEPILRMFEEETGIRVQAVYDTEAVKTVGLVNRLISERNRPMADVFWNNEILRSIQLKNEGITMPYHSPMAAGMPDSMKDADGHWTGFGARARVIMVNTQLLPNEADWPRSVNDLTDPKWQGRAAFARPLFGTTSTHAAVIWAKAGGAAAQEFWLTSFQNAIVEAGNAQARDRVRDGELMWCLTDTDDAYGAIADGAPVAMIYPESDPAGAGAIFLPNTVMLINGAPNEENGQKLIDFLLSAKVEEALAKSRAAQIPLREGVPGPEGIPPLRQEDIMDVDWNQVYDALAESAAWLDRTMGELNL